MNPKVKDKVIEILNGQTDPIWLMPWFIVRKQNLKTRRPYNGMNRLLLSGAQDNYFLTFNQVQEMGGHVKAGSKGNLVVFWKFDDRQIVQDTNNEGAALELRAERSHSRPPLMRTYYVFALKDIEGIERPKINPTANNQDIDRLILASQAQIQIDEKAYYSPIRDFIGMPEMTAFKTPDDYYRTIAHELIHWTGNEARLNRIQSGLFASAELENYSAEELTAEIGASLLCSEFGIMPTAQNAAYIQNWKSKLKENGPEAFITALSKAQKAVDYLMQTYKDKTEQFFVKEDKQ